MSNSLFELVKNTLPTMNAVIIIFHNETHVFEASIRRGNKEGINLRIMDWMDRGT
jgi:hypothetical protein